MSYCRWSSEDFTCDAYVYEDAYGGWITYIASTRPLIDREALPGVPDIGTPGLTQQAWGEAYVARRRAIHDQLDTCDELDLSTISSEAGARFVHDSPGACADNLERLAGLGFNVPQYAIDDLRAEQDELNTHPKGCQET